MYPYATFIFLALALSFFFPKGRRGGKLLMWVFFVPLFIFIGFRHEIGPDWFGYEYNFTTFKFLEYEWKEILLRAEPAYYLLNKLSDELDWGLHGVMAVCAFLFVFGITSYATRTQDPWLALGVVLPYLVFVIGMSAIRQAAAIGIAYYMLANRKDLPLVVQMGLIGLATAFHSSATIFLLFILFESRAKLLFRLVLVALVVGYLYNQWSDAESFFRYKSQYVQAKIESGGALYHVLLTAFPAALYLLSRKRIEKTVGLDKTVYAASWLSLAAIPLVFVSSTATDRMVLYFSFVQMMAYPALVKAYPSQGRLVKLAVAGIACIIFVVFFNFGEHAQYYIPYRNILFE